MKNYLLLKNGTTVYLPTVNSVDDVVTFDKNAIIPNMYTKTEVDDLISGATPTIDAYTKEETNNLLNQKANSSDVYPKTRVYTKEECDQKFSGGGGGGTTDYNQLINRPIIDGIVQSNLDMNGNSITKLYNVDASNNAFTISNPSSFKLSEWFKVENYENVRTDITTDKLLHINAPHILLNGELDNVYTKSASDARVRELFAELMNRTVQIQTLNTKKFSVIFT